MTHPEGEVREPNTGPHAGMDHEVFAGRPVEDPAWLGEHAGVADGANRDQTPEVTEFGRRAVESGDPDEDRPNGDPAVVGQPVGGGERSPEAPAAAEDTAAGDGPAAERA